MIQRIVKNIDPDGIDRRGFSVVWHGRGPAFSGPSPAASRARRRSEGPVLQHATRHFAHIPFWTVYPKWNWGTEEARQVLGAIRRFGSVTVLNGHIHQVMQRVEGNVTFHTALSTAFPQPTPGAAAAPGPMTVPAERLLKVLGITHVRYIAKRHSLATVDSPLEG